MLVEQASFRFYGGLNDFLPKRRRGGRFAVRLPRGASLKDAIEALGVPHPEVDLILVNGVPQRFAYRLRDGDDVAAFPLFRSIDITGVERTGADPPRPVRFALDVHLGKLTSLLRLAGFDSVVEPDDAALAALAAREDRVVLTRDVGLLKRSLIRHGYWVRHTEPERQLAELLARFDLGSSVEPFARCLRCNARLRDVALDAVSSRVPPRAQACGREFRECPGCRRVYWQGSHYDQLRALLVRALRCD